MSSELQRATWKEDGFSALHRLVTCDPAVIRRLFRHAFTANVLLDAGIGRRNEKRTTRILELRDTSFNVDGQKLDKGPKGALALSFNLNGLRFVFSADVAGDKWDKRLALRYPANVFVYERRDLSRERSGASIGAGTQVEFKASNGATLTGEVADSSYHGLGIRVAPAPDLPRQGDVEIRFVDGPNAGEQRYGRVHHVREDESRPGWLRLGLSVSRVRRGDPFPVETRDQILPGKARQRWVRYSAALLRASVARTSAIAARNIGYGHDRADDVAVVEYESARGECIRAIVDGHAHGPGGTVVVIPPAWGRTKETLSPLAGTIVETFKDAREPVSVLRFDGTHRRGESFVSPECRVPGSEYRRFTFSRAVDDIHATLKFLRADPRFRPSRVVLVTFSLSSVEGRRAVAEDSTGLICGWIPVVGMVDLQSALKTISGGIDYALGLVRGVRFGMHELVGVESDMDHTGLDALRNGLVFLEDARQDFNQITVPVTWIHGRFDAWMDLERIRDVMSCGKTDNRKLIEVPTGHQLRSSREALETFQLIGVECVKMATGRHVEPAIPNLARLDERRRAERRRLPSPEIRERDFWRTYLLGRAGQIGIELLTATRAYRDLMTEQVRMLGLERGSRVADLGAGVGDFSVTVGQGPTEQGQIRIDCVDLVPEALKRCRARVGAIGESKRPKVQLIVANLDAPEINLIPLRSEIYDAALMSLVISYVRRPVDVLAEVFRLLKPGGRVVLSSLRRDADISKLHQDGLLELEEGRAAEVLGADGPAHLAKFARDFLNDAARILDLEETGRFRFWDPEELRGLVRSAGFIHVRSAYGLGDPPQAAVVLGHKPIGAGLELPS